MSDSPARIAFAGSATNPGHRGHEAVLQLLLSCGKFDRVIWIPSGFNDNWKPELKQNAAIHRQQLALLCFPQWWIFNPPPGWAQLMLDFSEVGGKSIPTTRRFQMLRTEYSNAEISFVTGSDSVTPENGVMPIQTWSHYKQLTKEQIFIVPRDGFAQFGEVELPGRMQWLTSESLPDIRSSHIRQMIKEGNKDWRLWVNPEVAAYIDLYQLYR